MALPSSGPLGINQIRTELGLTIGSLAGLSNAAGKGSTPNAISEFYGYSNVSWPSGMTARYDVANYTGSTIPDSTGNGYTMSVSGVTYVSNSGNPYIQTAIGSSNQSITGNSSLYGSDFTWCTALAITGSNGDWGSFWWSEAGSKNFLSAHYAPNWNQTSAWFPRFDTSSSSYVPWNGGMGTTNNGTSPVSASANYIATSPMHLLTIRKSGNTLTWWDNTTCIWTFTGFSTFSIGAPNQEVGFLNRNGGGYVTPAKWRFMGMFNRALSDAEIGTVQTLMTSYS